MELINYSELVNYIGRTVIFEHKETGDTRSIALTKMSGGIIYGSGHNGKDRIYYELSINFNDKISNIWLKVT